MEDNHNAYKGTFLSSGDAGYRAPPPRKPDVKAVIQHIQRCRDEIMRNIVIPQQAALEQERLEAYFEQLAAAIQTLIEVIAEPGEGTILTSEWIQRRDEAQQEEAQEQK